MSRHKKILLMIIVMLIVLIGFPKKSNAYSEMFNPWTNLRVDGAWYCTDHSQGLHNTMIRYERVGQYTIIGNTCSGISDDTNAKIAYILYQNVSKSPDGNASAYLSKYPEQVALWLRLRSWYDKVGYRLNSGLSGLIGAPSYGDVDDYGKRAATDDLLARADNYANSIKGTMSNNTNQSNLKAQNYQKNGEDYIRVGPFNITYKGSFDYFRLIGNDDINIPIASYEQYNGSNLEAIAKPSSGKDFYVSFKVPENVYKLAKIRIGSKQREISVQFSFWRNPTGSNDQNMLHKDGTNYADRAYSADWDIEINLLGNINIKKTDQTTGKALGSIGFTMRMTSGVKAGQYVVQGSNHVAQYATNKSTIYTDNNGTINLTQLWPGTYELIETINPHYGYEETPKSFGTITIKAGETNKINLTNLRKYVKITGYAWEDILYKDGKETTKNDLYRQGTLDNNDQLLARIPVELKNMSGNVIARTQTNEQGQYVFEKVLIDELSNYYVEFQYNGMSYQNVTAKADTYLLDSQIAKAVQQGSNRVSEGNNRTQFNKEYETITYGKSNAHELFYNTSEGESELRYRKDNNTSQYNYGYLGDEATRNPITGVDEQYIIRANTQNTYHGGLDKIKTPQEIRENSIVEITDINLGIETREEVDLSLVKDIDTVKVHINGADHVYRYADRFNPSLYPTSGYEMEPQVKFGQKYGSMSYTRALYESDVFYTGDDTLEVKVTYKIGIKNNSTTLKSVVNEITDYYDIKYVDPEEVTVGKQVKSDGSIEGETLEIQKETSETINQAGYQKIRIKTNLEIEHQKEQYIYIQIQVRPDKIIEILGENDEEVKLDNIAEISSYTIKEENGELYAAIDKDSQPGRTDITNITTYEDDTDKAPGLKLILQEERKISGKVFEDTTGKVELITGEIREGDGNYTEEQDKPIQGVEVRLVNAKTGETMKIYDKEEEDPTSRWKDAIQTTDKNGEYLIKGFIPVPDNYKIIYTWGDEHYKVQDYKSTIVDETSYTAKGEGKQLEWYKDTFKTNYPNVEWDAQNHTEIRVSDAVDNYTTRQEIDEQSSLVINSNQHTIQDYQGNMKIQKEETTEEVPIITKMEASTPTFQVNLEYSTTPTNNPREEYELTEDGNIKIDENGYAVKKDGYQNHIQNIDFGIVERAKQGLALSKNIKNAKIISSTGMTLSNADIENGKLINKPQYVVYVPTSEGANGQVKFEIDSEIIQGARLEITYGLQVENISELDYLNQTYYQYGSKNAEGMDSETLVTLSATNVIDYLDDNIVIDLEENGIGTIVQNRNDKLLYITNGLLENTQEMKNLLDQYNRIIDITDLSKKLKPRGTPDAETKAEALLIAQKMLANKADGDEMIQENQSEIIQVVKSGGASLITIPGNYIPSNKEQEIEYDNSQSEGVSVVPPTGLTTNYIAYTILAISSLGILVVGIILIRKIVLGEK